MKKLHAASPKLIAPLQGLWRWLMPSVIPTAILGGTEHREFIPPELEASTYVKQRPCSATPTRASSRPLRVIRVPDPDESASSNVGRMFISGRMADVCAELDRLVANEQTLH